MTNRRGASLHRDLWKKFEALILRSFFPLLVLIGSLALITIASDEVIKPLLDPDMFQCCFVWLDDVFIFALLGFDGCSWAALRAIGRGRSVYRDLRSYWKLICCSHLFLSIERFWSHMKEARAFIGTFRRIWKLTRCAHLCFARLRCRQLSCFADKSQRHELIGIIRRSWRLTCYFALLVFFWWHITEARALGPLEGRPWEGIASWHVVRILCFARLAAWYSGASKGTILWFAQKSWDRVFCICVQQ